MKVVEFVLYCLTASGLSLFAQMCYQKGMILRWYYARIKYLYLRSPHKYVRFWMKPLGVCVYCQSFWVNFLLYPVIFNGWDKYFLLSIGGTYISIKILELID